MSVDDLSVGQWVTVLRWHPRERPETMNWLTGTLVAAATIHDNSWCGDPLRIVAINLPYVVVNIPKMDRTRTLDTRRLDLVPISEDYVSALLDSESND